jgi:hypothetical protein
LAYDKIELCVLPRLSEIAIANWRAAIDCKPGADRGADSDALLFTMSDGPLMRFLRYYRFEVGR